MMMAAPATGSQSGTVALPMFAPYACSKFGVEALSDCLRLELAGQVGVFGCRVTTFLSDASMAVLPSPPAGDSVTSSPHIGGFVGAQPDPQRDCVVHPCA
jgi:NAD(P)-dependent dehydrogenase (short-subunit alcohol dehydrogenase family)